jgi:hypothetical protein
MAWKIVSDKIPPTPPLFLKGGETDKNSIS